MKPSCATRDACVSPCFHVAPTPPEPVAPPRPIPAAGAASGRVVLRRQNRPGQSRCYLERRLPSRRLHPGAREPQTTTDRARNCTGWFVARSDQIDRSIRCAERAFARAERHRMELTPQGWHVRVPTSIPLCSMLESHLANCNGGAVWRRSVMNTQFIHRPVYLQARADCAAGPPELPPVPLAMAIITWHQTGECVGDYSTAKLSLGCYRLPMNTCHVTSTPSCAQAQASIPVPRIVCSADWWWACAETAAATC